MTTKIAVIGAGPGGYVAAVRAAQLGGQVIVIDKQPPGGTCLHWGCIPSKIMKTTADLLHHVNEGASYGLDIAGPVALNMQNLMARKERIIQAQVRGIASLLKHHHVELIQGEAKIQGHGSLGITGTDGSATSIAWDRLIIAAGTEPAALPHLPFDGRRILSSNDVLNLTALPESIVIVGGGVIGCEFACILSALGCRVTVVEALDRLLPLPSVDAACSKVLLREMKKRKITVLVNHTVTGVASEDGGLSITAAAVDDNSKTKALAAEKMLVCIGRRPVTDGLGLDALPLAADERGWIDADAHLRTAAPDVYAIGDILGPTKIQLAHVASMEGIKAAQNAMGQDSAMRYDAVPSAIFTMPEVANVGLTEEQARAQGLDCRSESVLFRTIGKAQVLGEIAGEAKVVFEASSGTIVGMHMIGPHVTDLIAEATLAVTAGHTVHDVAATIHAHPTLAEVLGEVAMKAAGRALHG